MPQREGETLAEYSARLHAEFLANTDSVPGQSIWSSYMGMTNGTQYVFQPDVAPPQVTNVYSNTLPTWEEEVLHIPEVELDDDEDDDEDNHDYAYDDDDPEDGVDMPSRFVGETPDELTNSWLLGTISSVGHAARGFLNHQQVMQIAGTLSQRSRTPYRTVGQYVCLPRLYSAEEGMYFCSVCGTQDTGSSVRHRNFAFVGGVHEKWFFLCGTHMTHLYDRLVSQEESIHSYCVSCRVLFLHSNAEACYRHGRCLTVGATGTTPPVRSDAELYAERATANARLARGGRVFSYSTDILSTYNVRRTDIPKDAIGIEMEYEAPLTTIGEGLLRPFTSRDICPNAALIGRCTHESSSGVNHFGPYYRCDYCTRYHLRERYHAGDQCAVRAGGGHNSAEFVAAICTALPERSVIAKSDSSIQNGAEFVSVPLRYKDAKEWLKTLCAAAAANGATTPDNVGMHIHINRAQFYGKSHVARFVDFFSRQEDFIKDFCGPARRRQFARGGYAEIEQSGFRAIVREGAIRGHHHEATAVDKEYTVEVRIFAATTVVEEALANVELCEALVEWSCPGSLYIPIYAKSAFAERKSIQRSFVAFIEWLLVRRKRTYPNLCAKIASICDAEVVNAILNSKRRKAQV